MTTANGANESGLLAAAELGSRNGYLPRVAHELPIGDVATAHELAERGVSGKVILRGFVT